MENKILIDSVNNLKVALNEISVYDFDVYTSMELYYKIAENFNKVIKELNRFEGVISDEIIKQNEKLLYLLGDGLKIEVVDKINEMVETGVFDTIINHNIFNNLKSDIKNVTSQLEQNMNKIKEQFNTIMINIENYSEYAVGGDWALAIRQAIKDIGVNGGAILFKTGKTYNLKSVDENNAHFSVGNSNIKFYATSRFAKLLSNVNCESMCYISNKDLLIEGLQFENIHMEGNYLSKYNVKNDSWLANASFRNSRFSKAIKVNAELSCYLSDITNCTFAIAEYGLRLVGLKGTLPTSNTINNSYAIQNTVGWYIQATYSSLNSCASDHCKIAYQLSTKGVSMNSCGAEGCEQLILSTNYCTETQINGLYTLGCGTDEDKELYLLDFYSPQNVVISGLNLNGVKKYTKKLIQRSNTSAIENITILDNSIKESECEYVSTLYLNKPIRTQQYTDKSITYNVNTTNVADIIKEINNSIFNTNITLIFDNGIYNNIILQNINTNGVVTLESKTGNKEDVIFNGGKYLVSFNNIKKVIIKNITIINTVNSVSSFIIDLNNTCVALDNVHLKSNLTCGSLANLVGSELIFRANVTSEGTLSSLPYLLDFKSKVIYPKIYTFDGSIAQKIHFNVGDILFTNNPVSTGNIGWVAMNSGFAPTFNKFGTIS